MKPQMYWIYRFVGVAIELRTIHGDAYPTWVSAIGGARRIVRKAQSYLAR